MRKGTVLALWGSLALLDASDARAEACDSTQPEAGAPIRAPLGPADFGMLPEACPGTSIELRGRLAVLIDKDDFYGNLHGGGALRGRIELPGDGLWLSAYFPGPEYRFVANATVESESVDLSASTLGLHAAIDVDEKLRIAPYLRLMLPTETVLVTARRFGVEHGISAVFGLHDMIEVVGGIAMPVLLTINNKTTHTLYMPLTSVDLGFRPWRWVEIMGGAAIRVALPVADDALESFDPRAALRFYPWRGFVIDAAGAFPLLGRDRTLAGVALTLGYVFDPSWRSRTGS